MITAFRLFAAAVVLAIIAPTLSAVTYIVPSDAEMIQRSDDIVVATGVTSVVEKNDRGQIVTRYTLRVEDVLKGQHASGDHLVLTERGGILDGKARIIAGTPEYHPGVRYLVFTNTNRDMEPMTFGMGLGQFFLVEESGQLLAVRESIQGYDQNLEAHTEGPRDAHRFAAYIRGIVAQTMSSQPDYFVVNPEKRQVAAEWKIVANAVSRGSYLMGGNFRWEFTPNANFVLSGTPPAGMDANDVVGTAVDEWNATASNIAYSLGGQDNSATSGLENDDGKDAVLFGDPNGEVGGAAAIGGAFGSHQYDLDGETFVAIFEADVVVSATLSSCFKSIITHEVGHTLGFRHSATAPSGKSCGSTADCTSSAIMNAVLNGTLCSRNGNLLQWDEDAASTVYGAGPVCTPPTITTHPQSKTISLGTTTSLTVSASGSTPLTFQWFIGNSGDTSTPTGTSSSTLSNLSPTTTTSYWVRVSNSCTEGGPASSNTAVVTVTCTNAGITTHPANKSITSGQSTQLSVTATGSNRTYQWFVGNSGDTSQPIGGATSTSVTVSPNTTTNYWVRVSAACGDPVDSNTATVTVTECASLTIGTPTATPGVGPGQFTLNISASSSSAPLKFEWFRGESPGIGGTKVGSTQSFFVTVTQVTSFWARVTNGCDRVKVSSLVTVAPCTLPAITTQPEDKTITSGGTTSLTIGFTGVGATVKWYRGVVGDRSAQVGTASTINAGPLTATTQYWAEVSNTCGPVASRQVTVTVEPLTETLLMLSQRFTVTVRYRNQFENPPTEGNLKGRSLSSTTLSDTAIFTFGDPLVIELMVRLSDARPFDNHIHVFYGGLSDVEFFITVSDSLTGVSKEYHKPANQLVGQVDRSTFIAVPGAGLFQSGVDALMADTLSRAILPQEDSSTILMLNSRYLVRMHYVNHFVNPPVEGYLLARSIASSTMTETAVFFGNPESVEWMVRFSDARPFDNHIHFYHGGLSDLELTVEVTDTLTGLHREYPKPFNTLVGAVDRLSWVP